MTTTVSSVRMLPVATVGVLADVAGALWACTVMEVHSASANNVAERALVIIVSMVCREPHSSTLVQVGKVERDLFAID